MDAALDLKQHPLSAAFPLMSANEFQLLKDSINNNGVLNPITIFDGAVIDGWHRYRAAIEVGMGCPAVELGDVDPQDFVLAQNKMRRNVTVAQLALATTAVYQWRPEGRIQLDTECPVAKTTAELAEISGVHASTIKQAKAVMSTAAPEVIEAVKSGVVGLPKAAAIAKLPKSEQAAALTQPLPKRIKHPEAEDIAFRESEPEDTGPDADELAAQEAAEQADRQTMQKLLDSDDALATAVKEITRLHAELFLLKQSRDAAMNRAAELAKWVKKRDFQITKLTSVSGCG